MNEIMAALYTRLNTELAYPVYDHVPQDTQVYPFVRINPIQTENDDTSTENGFQASVEIIGFSRYRGTSEINDVVDAVYAALHDWDMANTASFEVGTFLEDTRQLINAPDSLTRNSIQRFVFYFEPL